MIPIKPARGPRCDGCDHIRYSAPGGQAWNPAPHSFCTHFGREIPMVVVNGAWISSAIPPECPTYDPRQKRLVP